MVRVSTLVLGLVCGVATAQESKQEGAKKPEAVAPKGSSSATPKVAAKAIPGDVEVHFLNGSVLRMVVHSEKLDIATPYGTFAVPIRDVRAVEFGLHFPDGVAAKIDLAVQNLGHKEHHERDKAGRALLELSPYSYPAVMEASRAEELEVSRRAKELVKQIQAKHHKRDLKVSADDKVVTPTFTIVGRILTPKVKAKTDLFGGVELAIAQMRSLRAMAAPSQEMDLSVDAAKYANFGQWMDTGYEVDSRAPLLVTAKGLVDTWPQGPGQYMVGPSGVQGGQAVFNGGVVMVGGGVRRVVGGGRGGQVIGGMLVGRIGEDGEPFVIGDRYEGSPDADGKLYLHIGPSPWGCASTGSYEVKIGRKQ